MPPLRRLVTVGRTTTVVMTGLGLLWLPIMKSIADGGLYQYIQSVQSFLAPPIVAVFLTGLFWKRMNLRGAVWGLGLGFALGMSKLTLNAVCPNPDGYALLQDFYFSGLLLVTSVLVIVVASLSVSRPIRSASPRLRSRHSVRTSGTRTGRPGIGGTSSLRQLSSASLSPAISISGTGWDEMKA